MTMQKIAMATPSLYSQQKSQVKAKLLYIILNDKWALKENVNNRKLTYDLIALQEW